MYSPELHNHLRQMVLPPASVRRQTGVRSEIPPAAIMQQFIDVEEEDEFNFSKEPEETEQDDN